MDIFSVIVETPAGSGSKFIYDPVNGRMKLNKVLPAGMTFPFDFGFLPGTKGGDNDPLDVLVISELTTFPGCALDCRIIGALVVQQSAAPDSSKTMRNDRFIAIPEASVVYRNVRKLTDLSKELRTQLEAFFINYIRLEGKQIRVEKRISAAQAGKLIHQFQDKLDQRLLFEIFLPLKDEKGSAFPPRYFNDLRRLLIKKFGGVTVYHRAPVTGIWHDPDAGPEQDQLIQFEVMARGGDDDFWSQLKADLAKKFRQEELLIRNSRINTI